VSAITSPGGGRWLLAERGVCQNPYLLGRDRLAHGDDPPSSTSPNCQPSSVATASRRARRLPSETMGFIVHLVAARLTSRSHGTIVNTANSVQPTTRPPSHRWGRFPVRELRRIRLDACQACAEPLSGQNPGFPLSPRRAQIGTWSTPRGRCHRRGCARYSPRRSQRRPPLAPVCPMRAVSRTLVIPPGSADRRPCVQRRQPRSRNRGGSSAEP
jgi:hypothetical protein